MASIERTFDRALASHREGRFDEAVRGYRKVLAALPDHDATLHYLGLAESELGRIEQALAHLRQAVALKPREPVYLHNLALVLKRAGRLDEAAARLEEALQRAPQFALAHRSLGSVELARGRVDAAIERHRQALALAPSDPDTHNELGIALQAAGRLDDAQASFEQALAWRPDDARVLLNLSNVMQLRGQLDEAIAYCERLVGVAPRDAFAHSALGVALMAQGRFAEAIETLERARGLAPAAPQIRNNLALALRAVGRLDEAERELHEALKRNPRYAEALGNLGTVHLARERFDDAAATLEQALALQPESTTTLNNLALAHLALRDFDRAQSFAERALAVAPRDALAHNNLGLIHRAQSELDEAMKCFRTALELRPDYTEAHGNLLFCMNYMPEVTPQQLFDAHRRFGERVEPALRDLRPRHHNVRDPERRLRIGYVSGDFGEHAMGFSILPLLANHDPQQVEVFCYATSGRADATTAQMRKHAAHWRSLLGVPDSQAAQIIGADAIDILVDLSGHTASNRLALFARKPAPLQAHWLGYVTTTGLTAIDYRFTDAQADPPGTSEAFHTETLERLRSVTVYRPPAGAPDVGHLPASSRGRVSFVSFNHTAKVTDAALDAWARILAGTPGSRLVVGNAVGTPLRDRLVEALARHGVAPERLSFLPKLALMDYLAAHGDVDIALDTFPYNGGATTCHALWMGVPVVALAGDRYMARMGASQLTQLGLSELIARDVDGYVETAIALAHDIDRLAQLRAGLRERMKRSPLCDERGFAAEVERAYRRWWRAWCAQG